jgi:hypothetical protein
MLHIAIVFPKFHTLRNDKSKVILIVRWRRLQAFKLNQFENVAVDATNSLDVTSSSIKRANHMQTILFNKTSSVCKLNRRIQD